MADSTNIPTGLNITSQIPLNIKENVLNEATLAYLGVDDNLAFTYHNKIKITCLEEGTIYEWREVQIGEENTGLIPLDFTYPIDTPITYEIDYSLKTFNFFPYQGPVGPQGPIGDTTVFNNPATFTNLDKYTYNTENSNLVLERLGDSYYTYRKCGLDSWEKVELTTNVPGNPLRTGAITIEKVKQYVLPLINTSDVVMSGTWFESRSGGADNYINGLESRSVTNTDTLTFTFENKAINQTLGLVFNTRSDCGICKITINGTTDDINLLPKTGSDVFIDTYSAIDFKKVHIPVSSFLPLGTVTVVLTVLGDKNPSSSNDWIRFNAFYLTQGVNAQPLSPYTKSPQWTTGTAVVNLEHVSNLGNEYSATGAGTTGATPPTHTTGTVSDGMVNWLWIRNSFSSDLDTQMVRQDTSESEYAGVAYTGASGSATFEWGGDIHGHEVQDSLIIKIDGTEINLTNGESIRGFEIKFLQNLTVTDPLSTDDVLTVEMEHYFNYKGSFFKHEQTALKSIIVISFFQWMHTFYHYDQLKRRILFDTVSTPINGDYLIADSYGDNLVQLGRENSVEMRSSGTAFKDVGSIGDVSFDGGTDEIFFTVSTDTSSMRIFNDSLSKAYIQLNPSGKTQPDGGLLQPNSGIFSKFYFKSIDATEITLQIGDKLKGSGAWNISLIKK